MSHEEVVVRKNIRDLTKKEQDDLIKAFVAIQALPSTHEDSFFVIAGYHGEPFRGAGYGNPQWWGGYCNHGNVLFPTWHRAYLHRLEKALQRQVPGVAIPYWDETEQRTLDSGLPEIFLEPKWTYGETKDTLSEPIDNPLFSYKFRASINDNLSSIPDANYSKQIGYETVRYPFSGLVGTDKDKAKTAAHNAILIEMGREKTNHLLNENIRQWLNCKQYVVDEETVYPAAVADKYKACLDAPNYTVFSNTTSAKRWNQDDTGDHVNNPNEPVVSLESPHNSIHLACGGFQVPPQPYQEPPPNYSKYAGANGDMGENDTASFDPVFYFHHSFIDLQFARWQEKMAKIDPGYFRIKHGYPGTNSVDSQGPTPGVAGGTWLTLDSPLEPFRKLNNAVGFMTSYDVVETEKLGYVYHYNGKKVDTTLPHQIHLGDSFTPVKQKPATSPILSLGGLNRANMGGSFLIGVWGKQADGSRALLGTEAVLSRRHITGCANCQNHLEVSTHLALHGLEKDQAKRENIEVKVYSRSSLSAIAGGDGQQDGADEKVPTFDLITHHLK